MADPRSTSQPATVTGSISGPRAADVEALHTLIKQALDDDQAVEMISIPLAGKSSITIWSAIDDLPASGIEIISTAWSSSSDFLISACSASTSAAAGPAFGPAAAAGSIVERGSDKVFPMTKRIDERSARGDCGTRKG